jgi:hypothetical protein
MRDHVRFAPGAFGDVPKEVPLTDRLGGKVIGRAVVRETEQGIVADIQFTVCYPCGMSQCDSAVQKGPNCPCCQKNHGR